MNLIPAADNHLLHTCRDGAAESQIPVRLKVWRQVQNLKLSPVAFAASTVWFSTRVHLRIPLKQPLHYMRKCVWIYSLLFVTCVHIQWEEVIIQKSSPWKNESYLFLYAQKQRSVLAEF